jgi:hypothetical protein
MARDKLCKLEIEIYNATRKFACKLNSNLKKQVYFAKMEDQACNGTNSSIIKLDCLGNISINGFARATYIYNSYNEKDCKVKIDGNKIMDKRTDKHIYHQIVKEYKDFLIREIPDVGRIIELNN